MLNLAKMRGFARFPGFSLSSCGVAVCLAVVGVRPDPVAPCSVVDFSCTRVEEVCFWSWWILLGLEKEEFCFFRIGGREESHGNLVVAPMSNELPATKKSGNYLQHM